MVEKALIFMQIRILNISHPFSFILNEDLGWQHIAKQQWFSQTAECRLRRHSQKSVRKPIPGNYLLFFRC
jgi:hypothetical protein